MKIVPTYKCHLCGKMEVVGDPFECDRPLTEEMSDCILLFETCTLMNRRTKARYAFIGGAHECKDGNSGIMDFAGFVKVDEDA